MDKAFNADLMGDDKPSFAMRALCNIDRERNGKRYVRNIRIITWDLIYFSSHKREYLHRRIDSNIVNEINEIRNRPISINDLMTVNLSRVGLFEDYNSRGGN